MTHVSIENNDIHQEIDALIADDSPRVGPIKRPAVDLDMTRKFLVRLTGEDAPFMWFEGIYPSPVKSHPNEPQVRQRRYPPVQATGTLANCREQLEDWNRAGYGIYYAVNAVAGAKRRASEVQELRAIWADFDSKLFASGEDCEKAVRRCISTLEPHIIVESSPGNYHVYWLVNSTDIERAKRIMQSIAQNFGSDSAVANVGGILRLPGFLHTKGEPVLTRMTISESVTSPYSIDDLAGAFGEAEKRPTAEVLSIFDHIPDHVRRDPEEVKMANAALLGGIESLVTKPEEIRGILSYLNPDMPNDQWVRVIWAIKAQTMGADYGLNLVNQWSRGDFIRAGLRHSADKYEDESDVEGVWNRGRSTAQDGDVTLGTVVKWARENGYAGSLSASIGAVATILTAAAIKPVESEFGASTGPSKRRSIFITGDELLAAPARIKWLVAGILPAGSVAMLFGESGAGKSFLALDLALSVATGQSWHSQRVKAGPVWYLAGEGFNGLRLRVRAWRKVHGGDLGRFRVTTGAIPFDSEGAAQLSQEIAEAQAAQDLPRLVVVDTLARHLVGDENSQKDAAQFVRLCGEIAAATGAAILVVHHSGHIAKERARGSSALRAAVDVEMALAGHPGGFDLRFTKVKDGKTPPVMAFTLKEVEVGEGEYGEPVTSAVPDYAGNAIPKPPHRPAGRSAVVELVEAHPGKTIEELRPHWTATGRQAKRLRQELQRGRDAGHIRCDEADHWWVA